MSPIMMVGGARRRGRRRGVTALELLLALVIAGVLLALTVPRVGAYGDRVAARAARSEVVALFATARELAIARRAAVAVHVDTGWGRVLVDAAEPTGARSRSLRDLYGVRVAATRDSMAYDARGLGYGAANLRIIASRGNAAETIYVSRLGRVR